MLNDQIHLIPNILQDEIDPPLGNTGNGRSFRCQGNSLRDYPHINDIGQWKLGVSSIHREIILLISHSNHHHLG